ncbi:DNA-binding NarL/FixJ family response regulator [Mucilaginibacter sp. AK015]|nr:DNA-binding NarL/FixJ family response regulator [Mucilaginibacter sp. AK015]
MFKSVLIVEDHESANISVQKTVTDLGISRKLYAYYCDDALMQIRKAEQAGDPFELMITDLSFEEDKDRKQQLPDGRALIRAVRDIQPALKVLVFSAESRPAVVSDLFTRYGIDGYVRKARRDAQELRLAIEDLFKHKQHIPAEFRQELRQHNAHAFSAYDVTILRQLSGGKLQKEIPAYLQANGITPSGLSSIEKRLNLIKEALGFSKNEQLIAYCKDKGII